MRGKVCILKIIRYLWKKLRKMEINRKLFYVQGSEEFVLLKVSILSKAIYRFNKIPKKFQWCFYRNRKSNPTIHMESQKTSSSQSNPEKKYTGVLKNAGS